MSKLDPTQSQTRSNAEWGSSGIPTIVISSIDGEEQRWTDIDSHKALDSTSDDRHSRTSTRTRLTHAREALIRGHNAAVDALTKDTAYMLPAHRAMFFGFYRAFDEAYQNGILTSVGIPALHDQVEHTGSLEDNKLRVDAKASVVVDSSQPEGIILEVEYRFWAETAESRTSLGAHPLRGNIQLCGSKWADQVAALKKNV